MSFQIPFEVVPPGPAKDIPAARGLSSAPRGVRRLFRASGEVPALYLLALIVALLAGCGSAGKPGTFSSQNYGYSTALPAGWSGHQATYPWNGGGSPGFEDSDVDLFGGPNGITVMAYGTASPESLTAYTRTNIQEAAAIHSCPAVPASDQAITIGCSAPSARVFRSRRRSPFMPGKPSCSRPNSRPARVPTVPPSAGSSPASSFSSEAWPTSNERERRLTDDTARFYRTSLRQDL